MAAYAVFCRRALNLGARSAGTRFIGLQNRFISEIPKPSGKRIQFDPVALANKKRGWSRDQARAMKKLMTEVLNDGVENDLDLGEMQNLEMPLKSSGSTFKTEFRSSTKTHGSLDTF